MSKDPSVQKLLQRAYFYLENDRWLHAVQFFQQVISLAPTLSTPYYELGKIYFYHKRYTSAEQQVKKALEIDPYDVSILFLMGNIHLSQEHYLEALEIYHQMEKNGESFTELYFNLGLTYARLGNTPDATRYLRMVLRYDPNFTGANEILGELLLFERNFTEAIKYLRRAVESNPDNWMNHFYLGQAYVNRELWEDAYESFSIAHTLNPQPTKVMEQMGWTLFNLNQYDEAEQVLVEALRQDEKNADVCTQLGRVCLELWRVEEGVQWLEKAVALNPKHPIAIQELERGKNLLRKRNEAKHPNRETISR